MFAPVFSVAEARIEALISQITQRIRVSSNSPFGWMTFIGTETPEDVVISNAIEARYNPKEVILGEARQSQVHVVHHISR
ncbi:unnamed protein product [Protopolystoma xenopodis]|uniref:Uncharacterized protein n=1 Tax=Protopolystoma xenopodis TaxID=117903 RepID=A0A3S5BWA0_9PLAT|nr:unnamed protein product [Protopolystoma xenopodis]